MRNTATITINSHGFTISDYNGEFYDKLKLYCARFTKYKMVPVMVHGRRIMKKEPDVQFGSAFKNRHEVRLHINCYEEFKRHMQQYGYNVSRFKEVRTEIPEGRDAPFKFKFEGVEPREHQVEWLDYQLTKDQGDVTTKINTLQTGKGKATSLSTPVKIPGGWKLMGDIKVGDVVTAWDGTPTNVTAVHPQPVKQLYNVTFGDGRSVEVCGEHLWEVYYVNTVQHKRWRVVDTLEVLRLISMPNPRVYVRLIKPEATPQVKLPIDPYVLGYLIGNGNYSHAGLTVSTRDTFVINEFQKVLDPELTITHSARYNWCISKKPGIKRNIWLGVLKELGMHGSIHYQKSIPEIYMNGSIEQRLALLQGLMDSDGTVNKPEQGAALSYCTVSDKLAEQVQYLVRSLGGIASIAEKSKYYTYKGAKKLGRLAYQVNIRVKQPSELFRVPRKKERCIDDGQYNDILKLRVKSVEPTREGLSQCITVDHPDHLFVVKDFIVTHNTFCGIYNMVKLGKVTVITIMPKYINTWIVALNDFVALSEGDIMVVQGSGELNGCMKLAAEGKLKSRIIIVSLPTFQYFMKEYETNNGVMTHYDYTPDQFWSLINPGFLIVDEGHESIHALFKFDMYTNVRNKLVLSATLEADDPFINDMYYVIYPNKIRFNGGVYDKYIEAIALMYGLVNSKKVKTKGFGGAYNHVKFEQSIMKDKQLLQSYLALINKTFSYFFLEKMESSQRCLIYCATVEMCLYVTDYLSGIHDTLLIRKYTQEDPKETLYESDVSVSTLKSAGTGVDVPGLRTCIMTIAIGSRQANDQALGRLRRLKDYPDTVPTFVYFVCSGIEAHMKYHDKKKELFPVKTLSLREVNSGFSL